MFLVLLCLNLGKGSSCTEGFHCLCPSMCRIPWNYSHLVLSKSFLICQTLSDRNLILHSHIILYSISNYMSEIKNCSITTLLSVPFQIMWLNLLWKIFLCQLYSVDSEQGTILEVCSQFILVHIYKLFRFSSTHRERNVINISGLFWSVHWRLRSRSWHILELLQIFTLKSLPETVRKRLSLLISAYFYLIWK